MKLESMSIRKAIQMISDRELLLPHIQRPFVWKQDRTNKQVQRFFDSIMRQYPIGTFLYWITKDDIRTRRFIEDYRDELDVNDFYIKSKELTGKKKTLVLDGQQRLQALYIALKGTYNGAELYLDILSGRECFYEGSEEFKYDFEYLDEEHALELNHENGRHYWVRFKDVVLSNDTSTEIRRKLLKNIRMIRALDSVDETCLDENVSRIRNLFNELDLIHYYPIDSTYGKSYEYDEILEIFIRTNSGGTILKKSDLMFALMKLSWDDAEEQFENLLRQMNGSNHYEFDKDFILKSALVVMGKRAKYDIKKFKGEEGVKNLVFIRDNWDRLKKSFGWLIDFLHYARINTSHALPSYNSLIPLVLYSFFHNNKVDSLAVKNNIQVWLYKALLNGNFSGQSDQVIDACSDIINEKSSPAYFPYLEIEQVIREKFGRATEFDERSLNANECLILNLVYLFNNRVVNFQPVLSGNKPEIDHIFPRSVMLGKKYRHERALVNDVGNYMFLEKSLNIEKSARLPDDYFEEAIKNQKDFLERNAIPTEKRLRRTEHFREFVEERRKIIYRIVESCLAYSGSTRQRTEDAEHSSSAKSGWSRHDIEAFMDDARAHKPHRYRLTELLVRSGCEVDYYELKTMFEKKVGQQFNYYQFGGILAGITKASKKKGKEKLIMYDDEGYVVIPNQLREMLLDYFNRPALSE